MPTPSGLPTKTDFQNATLDVAHLGRVVNSKDASGAPITTSTNRTGGVNKTLDALETEYTEAIRNAGSQPLGDGTWQAGQTFTAYNQFMVYNGIAYKPLTTTTLPYGPTGATPDLAFVGPFSDVTDADITIAQGELVGGVVFPSSGDLTVGMTVPIGTTHLRVDGAIYVMSPVASGLVADLTAMSATIGGTSVAFISVLKEQKFSSFGDALLSEIYSDGFEIVSYFSGWAAESVGRPIGGSRWEFTGDTITSSAGTFDGKFIYDASGKKFALKNKSVSPQMFGANAGDDSSLAFSQAVNYGLPVFSEGDFRLESGSLLQRNNLKIDLNHSKVICSFAGADVIALDVNGKSKTKIVNGTFEFLTSGKAIGGRFQKLTIEDINFMGGTLAIQVGGSYGAECDGLDVHRCTHDGSTPVLGAGGFLSFEACKNVRISYCQGKDGGEWIDSNNLNSYVSISCCTSENYKENHYDINSTWHCKVVNSIVISTESGMRSRPIWVSDHTKGSGWPVDAPDRLKNSNFVTFENVTLIIENFDYTEVVIFNVGTEYNPFVSEGRRLEMKWVGGTIDCRGAPMGRDKLKFGIYAEIVRWTITDNDFLSCGLLVHGVGKVNDNTFDLRSDAVGTAIELTMTGGTCSDNGFYGWTGTASASASGGVVYSNACSNTTFGTNNFYSQTNCHSVITSSSGGTNRYIENGFSMETQSFGGVRSNPGDVVLYNGATQ